MRWGDQIRSAAKLLATVAAVMIGGLFVAHLAAVGIDAAAPTKLPGAAAIRTNHETTTESTPVTPATTAPKPKSPTTTTTSANTPTTATTTAQSPPATSSVVAPDQTVIVVNPTDTSNSSSSDSADNSSQNSSDG